VAEVSGTHPDLGPELRQLAQSILDKLDPAVRLAAARAAAGGAGKCQQVWCPVCALASLVAGEQHPLLTVIAEHSVALMAVVKAVLEGAGPEGPGPSGPDGPPPPSPGGDEPPPPPVPSRYQHIPVTVEE
jgi:hypothetical protein